MSSPRNPGRQAAALALPCLTAILAALALLWWQREALVAEATQSISTERSLVPALEAWGRTPAAGRLRGVFFGDSLTMALGRWGGRPDHSMSLPSLVSEGLRSAGLAVRVLNATHAAFQPTQLAYLLEDVLAGRPRFVVVEINLRHLSPSWRPAAAMRFLPLSRRLSLRRELQLRWLLREEGLGLLDPTLYRLQDSLSLLYAVEGVRLRWSSNLRGMARDLEPALGLASRRIPATRRPAERETYASDPSAHRLAAVLRQVRAELAAAGVWPLFYVSPVNPAALRAAGGPDAAEMAAAVERLRAAVRAAPDEWLDLHAGLGESAFRDRLNHLRPEGLGCVAARLAERIYGRERQGSRERGAGGQEGGGST